MHTKLSLRFFPTVAVSAGLPPFNVIVALLVVYIIWGSTYLGVRVALESFPPFMLTSLRSGAAAAILLVILLLRGYKLPSFIEIRNAMIIGVLLFGGGAGAVAYAEQWVSSGLAALAVGAVPIWAGIFSGLFGQNPNRTEWVGLLIGLVGLVLLNLENGMQANPIGAIALTVGPMLWAFASMWSKRLTLPPSFMGAVFQLFGGASILALMSLLTQENLTEMPSTRSVLVMIYLTVFGTLVAFSAYMYLVRTVRPALATSYAYVNPVIAVVLGITLASEEISPLGVVAMIVILTGVVVVTLSKNRR